MIYFDERADAEVTLNLADSWLTRPTPFMHTVFNRIRHTHGGERKVVKLIKRMEAIGKAAAIAIINTSPPDEITADMLPPGVYKLTSAGFEKLDDDPKKIEHYKPDGFELLAPGEAQRVIREILEGTADEDPPEGPHPPWPAPDEKIWTPPPEPEGPAP
jgi:hypothetical protein